MMNAFFLFGIEIEHSRAEEIIIFITIDTIRNDFSLILLLIILRFGYYLSLLLALILKLASTGSKIPLRSLQVHIEAFHILIIHFESPP